MPITEDDGVDQFLGTNAETALPVEFEFHTGDDIKVESTVVATGVNTTLTKDTHYRVTGGGTPATTGTVYPIDWANNFPLDTVRWTITRDEAATQVYDPEGSETPASDDLGKSLDRIVSKIQEIEEVQDRCIKYPVGDVLVGGSRIDSVLPGVASRLDEYVVLDGSGVVTTTSTAPSTLRELDFPMGTFVATAGSPSYDVTLGASATSWLLHAATADGIVSDSVIPNWPSGTIQDITLSYSMSSSDGSLLNIDATVSTVAEGALVTGSDTDVSKTLAPNPLVDLRKTATITMNAPYTAGDMFYIIIFRDSTVDTNTADMQLHSVKVTFG